MSAPMNRCIDLTLDRKVERNILKTHIKQMSLVELIIPVLEDEINGGILKSGEKEGEIP